MRLIYLFAPVCWRLTSMRAETSYTQCLEGGLVQSSSSITICNWTWNKKQDRNFISGIWYWRCHKGQLWSSVLLPVALDFNAVKLWPHSASAAEETRSLDTHHFSLSVSSGPGAGRDLQVEVECEDSRDGGDKMEEFPCIPPSRPGQFHGSSTFVQGSKLPCRVEQALLTL